MPLKRPLEVLLSLTCVTAHAQTCQPASIVATTPSERFRVSGDGTVTDGQTGLMWKQCSEGQAGSACTGTAIGYTWPGALQAIVALNHAGGFAGFSDWRLPNSKELRTLVEQQCYAPAINLTVFPNTPASWYWSAPPVAYYSDSAWYVRSNDGKGHNGRIRLVRSGQ